METDKIQSAEDEINLIDYLIVLRKWKRLIVGIPLFLVAVSALASLLLPKTYQAETRLLPPQQGREGIAAQLLSQVGSGLTGLGGMLGADKQADLYVGMLQSRTILDRLITRFDLKKLYHDNTFDDARKDLKRKINVLADPKSGVIVISVEDKDPRRAADMANAFVEELRGMTKTLAVSEAAQRRLFFEEQLKDTKVSLLKAEESVKGFQERTGTLQVDEQVKAVIRNIAQLRAEIAAKEVQVRVVRTYSRPNNPDLQREEAVLNGMRAELAKLESNGGTGRSPLIASGRMPSVGTEYVRKLRDLKFNETLYELLLKQYELAKLDEARDATVIQVIDRAVPPEKQVRPKMLQMVVIAAFVSFIGSIAIAFFMEQRERMARKSRNSSPLEQQANASATSHPG